MIEFTSFRQKPETISVKHPEDVDMMDLDEDEDFLEIGSSKITYPGEYLTSSQAFMR